MQGTLYASVTSLRCNTRIKSFYDLLISNHKLAKVAIIAVMRKLLAFIHALFKNNSKQYTRIHTNNNFSKIY